MKLNLDKYDVIFFKKLIPLTFNYSVNCVGLINVFLYILVGVLRRMMCLNKLNRLHVRTQSAQVMKFFILEQKPNNASLSTKLLQSKHSYVRGLLVDGHGKS